MPPINQTIMSQHIASMPRQACIIAAGRFGGALCLFKNRDRNYIPKVRVVHEVRDGVEIAYLQDEKTGWVEGLNAYGIGIVNSALMVSRDESERDEVERTGKKLLDGNRILRALQEKTVEAAVKSVRTYRGGLRGHTVVSDDQKTAYVELPDKKDKHGNVPQGDLFVRTNHGIEFPDAGYVEGPREESSKNRQAEAEKVLSKVTSPEDIGPAILRARKDRWEPTEMVRDNRSDRKMRTTTQMVLDLTGKRLLLYLISDRVDYLGLDNRLPKGYKPVITIQVKEYKDLSAGTDADTKIVRKKEAHLLPILEPTFNLREIFKQLVLLEDHLFHERKRCPDCIWKHLLTAEALAEEAVTLDVDRVHENILGLAEEIRDLQRAIHMNIPLHEVAQGVRAIRKGLLGVASSVKVGRDSLQRCSHTNCGLSTRQASVFSEPNGDLYHHFLQKLRAQVDYNKERDLGNTPSLWLAWRNFYTQGAAWSTFVLEHTKHPSGKAKALEMAVRQFSKVYGLGKGPKDIVAWFEANEQRFEFLSQARSWPLRQEDPANSVLHVGPFEVVNTVQAGGKDLAEIVDSLNAVIRFVRQSDVPDLASTLYGTVYIVGQIERKSWAAWYKGGPDTIFLRPRIRGISAQETVRHFIHELAHRLWAKKLSRDVKAAWTSQHKVMGVRQPKPRLPDEGEVLPFHLNSKRVRYEGRDGAFGRVVPVDGGEALRVNVMKLMSWMQDADHAATFPTTYARTDAEEHFAEAVSLYVLGKLNGDNLQMFEEIVLGKQPMSVRVASRWVRTSGDLIRLFPDRKVPPRPKHTVTLGGKKYALSSDGGPLGEQIESIANEETLLLQQLVRPDPYRFLWAYDTEEGSVSMWRTTDGSSKVWGTADGFASKIVSLDAKGELNRVTSAEMRELDQIMRRLEQTQYRRLTKWLAENASEYQKFVDKVAWDVFNRDIKPMLVRGLNEVSRGVVPIGFKVNERMLDHMPYDRQLRLHVITEALAEFTEQKIEDEVRSRGVDPDARGHDNQAAQWAREDVVQAVWDKYAGSRNV